MTRGTYVLLVHVPYRTSLSIGGLGNVDFEAGYYAYVGSALGGLEKRVNRHLKSKKKLYWHIDHFLLRARAFDVIVGEGEKQMECVIAKNLTKHLPSIKGFGCSDCTCESHLFYARSSHELTNLVVRAFKAHGLKPKDVLKYG
jgi:Uri superfamily endonuclease